MCLSLFLLSHDKFMSDDRAETAGTILPSSVANQDGKSTAFVAERSGEEPARVEDGGLKSTSKALGGSQAAAAGWEPEDVNWRDCKGASRPAASPFMEQIGRLSKTLSAILVGLFPNPR
jgi:hypothetical protein